MVAAARLRRAQERVLNARPYANQMLALLRSMAARTEQQLHPLLAVRPVKRVLLVLVTADRGLCGAFNTNLIRAAMEFVAANRDKQVFLFCVGRKGRDFFRKRTVPVIGELVNFFNRLEFGHAQSIAKLVIDQYINESVDAVTLVYNEFKSVLRQRVVVEDYLPIKPLEPTADEALVDYIYEQPASGIFRTLLPRYVETEIFRALLESHAAELAARMTAMDAATNNAAELVDRLTLYMNRVRQATITKEIIEIVSGAAAQ